MELSSEEKDTFNRKKRLIYRRMPLERKLSPIIHLAIDGGLLELIKNNNYLFITDMYIDYLEYLAQIEELNDNSKFYAIAKIYYNAFHFDENNKLFDKMARFSDFLNTRILIKVDDNQSFYEMYKDDGYYKNHWNSIDNKIIFDLYSYHEEFKDPYEYGEENYIRKEIMQRVMAYIMTRDDILLNKDLSRKIFEYTKNNIDRIEEHLLMNSNMKYEPHYQIVKECFNPETIVQEYLNNPYKKPLIK